jgi:hypothetical protein
VRTKVYVGEKKLTGPTTALWGSDTAVIAGAAQVAAAGVHLLVVEPLTDTPAGFLDQFAQLPSQRSSVKSACCSREGLHGIEATVRRSARERLLAAANELFYAEGVQSVGIDRVISTPGCQASL